jgi:hypothetical protein
VRHLRLRPPEVRLTGPVDDRHPVAQPHGQIGDEARSCPRLRRAGVVGARRPDEPPPRRGRHAFTCSARSTSTVAPLCSAPTWQPRGVAWPRAPRSCPRILHDRGSRSRSAAQSSTSGGADGDGVAGPLDDGEAPCRASTSPRGTAPIRTVPPRFGLSDRVPRTGPVGRRSSLPRRHFRPPVHVLVWRRRLPGYESPLTTHTTCWGAGDAPRQRRRLRNEARARRRLRKPRGGRAERPTAARWTARGSPAPLPSFVRPHHVDASDTSGGLVRSGVEPRWPRPRNIQPTTWSTAQPRSRCAAPSLAPTEPEAGCPRLEQKGEPLLSIVAAGDNDPLPWWPGVAGRRVPPDRRGCDRGELPRWLVAPEYPGRASVPPGAVGGSS